MEKKVCKKCGEELPQNAKGKYCKDCKKKIKKQKKLIKFAVTTTAVTAAGVYAWCKQPQYVKDFLIAASKDKAAKTRAHLLKKAAVLQKKGLAMIKESAQLKKQAGKCPFKLF